MEVILPINFLSTLALSIKTPITTKDTIQTVCAIQLRINRPLGFRELSPVKGGGAVNRGTIYINLLINLVLRRI